MIIALLVKTYILFPVKRMMKGMVAAHITIPLKILSLIILNIKRRTLTLYFKWFVLRRLIVVPFLRTAIEYLQVVESAKLTKKREKIFIERIFNHLGTYIDVGANVGDTIYYARNATMIIAIEPDKRCLPKILAVAKKLEFKNFKLFSVVVGDGNEVEFALTAEGAINTGVNRLMELRKHSVIKKIKTKTYKLDDLLEGMELVKPVLIKIDTEGMEHLVLDGADKTIRHYKPTLLIETHMNLVECLQKLELLKYEIVEVKKRNDSQYYIIAESRE